MGPARVELAPKEFATLVGDYCYFHADAVA